MNLIDVDYSDLASNYPNSLREENFLSYSLPSAAITMGVNQAGSIEKTLNLEDIFKMYNEPVNIYHQYLGNMIILSKFENDIKTNSDISNSSKIQIQKEEFNI
jgi:hypothetical protein